MTPTNNALPELLPCPFCGGEVTLFGTETTGYFAACSTRDCYGFNCAKFGREETEAAWNRREWPDIKPDGFDAREIAACDDIEQLRNWAGCMRRERDNWRQRAKDAELSLSDTCRASAGREAVATDPMTLSAPEKVWLQVNTDGDDEDDRLPIPRESWMDLSWCYESIGGHEVVYIREDLVPTAPELPKQGEGGREDAARLDWLMGGVDRTIFQTIGGEWCAQDDVIGAWYGATPREAIDNAIRALAKKAEGA